jgi:hypothetical protein
VVYTNNMRNNIPYALGESVVVEINDTPYVMIVSAVDIIKNTVRVYSKSLGWILMLQFDQNGVVFNFPNVKISRVI